MKDILKQKRDESLKEFAKYKNKNKNLEYYHWGKVDSYDEVLDLLNEKED